MTNIVAIRTNERFNK